MAAIPDARPLTPEERRLLEWLLEHGTPAAADFKAQLPDVSVVSHCGCGCPSIDLAVGGRSASPSGPIAILADGFATSPEGVRVGVILFGRDGILSELEIYSAAGYEGAFSLPRIEDIELYTDA